MFHHAAEGWHRPRSRAEDDFKAYLNGGRLPHYVRDYLRREKIGLQRFTPRPSKRYQ